MSGHGIAAIISATCCLILVFIIYFKAPKNSTRKLYLLFNMASLPLIITSCVMWGINNKALVVMINRVANLFAAFFPVLFVHLVYTLIKSKIKKPLLVFSYTAAVIICILTPTTLFIKDFTPYKNLYFLPVLGPVYTVFIIYLYSILAIAYVDLYIKTRKARGIEKTRLLLFAFGSALGFIGLTAFYMLMYRVDIFWASIPHDLFIIAYLSIISYAIIRHKLMDIEVIIRKTLVFTGLLIFIFTILILPTLILQEHIFRNAGFGGKIAGLAISGIIIILTMRRIEAFLMNVTDKYLFQKKYDYKELVKIFTSEVLTVLDLKRLVDLTVSKLKTVIRLDSCKLEVFDNVNRPSLPHKEAADAGETLTIPLILNNDIIGMLHLGKKKSDESYNQDDLDVLIPLSKALAIAISNAQLFDELGKTQAETAQKDKMATVGTLAAGMAHEIRNPITTIKIFSDYLPEKLNEEGFVSKYKDMVVKQVDKIDHIIQTMIDFSGDSATSAPESVSLNEVVDELITLMSLSRELGTSIEFIKNIPPSLPDILVNRKELDEIILNLTQNAMNAIKDKGSITFQAEEGAECVKLSVKDTGCGMADNTIKHIFSPFFTTRSSGFGLGLFIVNDLVKRNSGKISLESEVGKGTTFKIEFQKRR